MCLYLIVFYEILTERNTRLDVYQSIAIAFTIWKISIFEKGERTEYSRMNGDTRCSISKSIYLCSIWSARRRKRWRGGGQWQWCQYIFARYEIYRIHSLFVCLILFLLLFIWRRFFLLLCLCHYSIFCMVYGSKHKRGVHALARSRNLFQWSHLLNLK